MEPDAIKAILDLAGRIGSPAVGVLLSFKFLLNGMRDDVREIKSDVKDMKQKQDEHGGRIAFLEGHTRQH